jgi:hypothetical protein
LHNFTEHSPNYIAVADVAFGSCYVVFLSTESRLYFQSFGKKEEMVELKTPKVKMMSHFASHDREGHFLLL